MLCDAFHLTIVLAVALTTTTASTVLLQRSYPTGIGQIKLVVTTYDWKTLRVLDHAGGSSEGSWTMDEAQEHSTNMHLKSFSD
jgi:hypothetical protein